MGFSQGCQSKKYVRAYSDNGHHAECSYPEVNSIQLVRLVVRLVQQRLNASGRLSGISDFVGRALPGRLTRRATLLRVAVPVGPTSNALVGWHSSSSLQSLKHPTW